MSQDLLRNSVQSIEINRFDYEKAKSKFDINESQSVHHAVNHIFLSLCVIPYNFFITLRYNLLVNFSNSHDLSTY